jgi:hypothetical protein
MSRQREINLEGEAKLGVVNVKLLVGRIKKRVELAFRPLIFFCAEGRASYFQKHPLGTCKAFESSKRRLGSGWVAFLI